MEFPMSAEEFAAKAKQLAETQGITLTGNQGKISRSGVTASYLYEAGKLKVEILEKPFFVSTDYCEEQLRNWIQKS
ncbi:hypothetical protein SAMN05421770_103402 [Granulicella rosea]|uniref:Uncharacterized protein n=1 Tax=Granulicella rosea TaxID=474952 RepID=A0A239J2A4_9BACT|nr:hypothetical protein [Granulicella rosea]SNS99929.1 hypothetical protein SAMN05421770_103402 [Granulicella rosea]